MKQLILWIECSTINCSWLKTKIFQVKSYAEISPPYTFFLLNGDMELHRNRHLFIEKMF
jgi:hypothetical protein